MQLVESMSAILNLLIFFSFSKLVACSVSANFCIFIDRSLFIFRPVKQVLLRQLIAWIVRLLHITG